MCDKNLIMKLKKCLSPSVNIYQWKDAENGELDAVDSDIQFFVDHVDDADHKNGVTRYTMMKEPLLSAMEKVRELE